MNAAEHLGMVSRMVNRIRTLGGEQVITTRTREGTLERGDIRCHPRRGGVTDAHPGKERLIFAGADDREAQCVLWLRCQKSGEKKWYDFWYG